MCVYVCVCACPSYSLFSFVFFSACFGSNNAVRYEEADSVKTGGRRRVWRDSNNYPPQRSRKSWLMGDVDVVFMRVGGRRNSYYSVVFGQREVRGKCHVG